MRILPPAAVFAQVNDLHHWRAWNPWGNMDRMIGGQGRSRG